MAAFNKFNQFPYDLATKKHDLNADVLKAVLTSTAPVAANQVLADLTQIANGNGYTTDGASATNSGAGAAGTYTITGTNVTWTCVTSAMAAFRYVAIYNSTQTVPSKPLVGWWDYGSALTLQVGDTFTVQWNGGASTGTILTVA